MPLFIRMQAGLSNGVPNGEARSEYGMAFKRFVQSYANKALKAPEKQAENQRPPEQRSAFEQVRIH